MTGNSKSCLEISAGSSIKENLYRKVVSIVSNNEELIQK